MMQTASCFGSLKCFPFAQQGGVAERKDLWRGLKDMELELEPRFLVAGGSENAPMSTTTSLEVAVRYSASAAPTLLRLRTSSSYERGTNRPRTALAPNLCGQHRYQILSSWHCTKRANARDPACAGADLHYLSAFPAENEILYPPLTYLRPIRVFDVPADTNGELVAYKVIEVVPTIA